MFWRTFDIFTHTASWYIDYFTNYSNIYFLCLYVPSIYLKCTNFSVEPWVTRNAYNRPVIHNKFKKHANKFKWTNTKWKFTKYYSYLKNIQCLYIYEFILVFIDICMYSHLQCIHLREPKKTLRTSCSKTMLCFKVDIFCTIFNISSNIYMYNI